MYAIIQTGGKQVKLSVGNVVSVEHLDGTVGKTVNFNEVLLVGGTKDGATLVGTPYVGQAAIEAEIVQQTKGEKLLTIKYRRRKGYRRTIGHRQMLTRLLVTKITSGKGESVTLDSAKKNELLTKASVPLAGKAEKKAAAPKKAAATSEKKTAAKKAVKKKA